MSLADVIARGPGALAIAIEDRVDVLFSAYAGHVVSVGAEIPPMTVSASDLPYLGAVHLLLGKLLRELLEKLQSVASRPAEAWFGSIGSTVVSIPGVVHGKTTLVQLPLLGSKYLDLLWGEGKNKKKGFNFPEELSEIIESVVGKNWDENAQRTFKSTVQVVNETTAAAIGEFHLRLREKKELIANERRRLGSFAYLKLHNGINAAAIGEKVTVNLDQSEAGHSYPILHPDDHKAEFSGGCGYHRKCYEAVLGIQSFTRRAALTKPSLFKSWNRKLKELKSEGRVETQGRCSGALDDALMQYILGQDAGVEFVAWYAAQLAHQLAVGPFVPEQIVLGGKLATSDVIDAVRIYVGEWANGFPHRHVFITETKKLDAFSKAGLVEFIVSAHEGGATTIEAHGAYAYAEYLVGRESLLKPLHSSR